MSCFDYRFQNRAHLHFLKCWRDGGVMAPFLSDFLHCFLDQEPPPACIHKQLVYNSLEMAEGEGFEPPVRLPVRLISSQVPLTTQPPFHRFVSESFAWIGAGGKFHFGRDSCPLEKLCSEPRPRDR